MLLLYRTNLDKRLIPSPNYPAILDGGIVFPLLQTRKEPKKTRRLERQRAAKALSLRRALEL